MLCRHPFIRDPTGRVFHSTNKEDWVKGVPFACGQCLPCRINKRRVWTTRIYLEAMSHPDNIPLMTFTYSDENLPLSSEGFPTLCKRHLQLFFKRIRKAGYKFRYYAAGEYGEVTHRPHYHILFFGLSREIGEVIAKMWPYGLVHLGYDTSTNGMSYVAGYVTKKFVKKDNSEGIEPEFNIMSRKPAIGSMALCVIVELIHKHPEILENVLNNPTLRIDGKYAPLGRTLSDKLRASFDFANFNDSYLFSMRKLALESRSSYDRDSDDFLNGPLVQALLAASKQRNLQIDRHFSIFNRRNKV